MDFIAMLKEYATAVETADANRLAALFTPDGVYHDTFYGEFSGPAAIREMLENRLVRDAEHFLWDFFDPVANGSMGYAKWAFSYKSKMPQLAGKRIVSDGVSHFELAGGKIKHYGQVVNGGVVLVQLGFESTRLEKVMLKLVDGLRSQPRFARHFAG